MGLFGRNPERRPFDVEPRSVPDVAGRDLRPDPPPNRANRDLIGYIEEGQRAPLRRIVNGEVVHPSGWVEPLSYRERLMRHTGRPECPIPEHTDALRRLGKAILERDEARKIARHRLDQIVGLERENARLVATVDYYRARLNHPARAQEAA